MAASEESGGAAAAFRNLRQTLVAELGALEMRPAVRQGQISAMLGYSDRVNVGQALVVGFSEEPVARLLMELLRCPEHTRVDVQDTRVWLTITQPSVVLARFGYRGGQGWAYSSGVDGTLGTLRGALAIGGAFSSKGLILNTGCSTHTAATVKLLASIGLDPKIHDLGPEIVITPHAGVQVLRHVGLSATSTLYGLWLNREPAKPAMSPKALRSRRIQCAANNAERAKGSAAAEAEWIAELGDLSAYGLPARWQQAAELRRDRRDLSYPELAEEMGLTKDAYTGLIRRFRKKINSATDVNRCAS
ncbi:Uncharacterised protein [Mycobacteroides abscessus subsp. massiliense]|uniref:helix-turn-helix domain-containing protein n=1 Tax=Mycobacteroides abscessus TaxID=36809 RepID=UPI0009C8558E|nr:helix-turn-helix domain-containing protein [Mycobacteroides abscessus]MBE5502619.1 hypothetical protein [Mycobacteroides abscessus]SLH52896.1 Uncharacterised protein [Mycobacteroides abscessus subsp. massiliense]